MEIDIPAYKKLSIDYLVLDYNGTLAEDGALVEGTRERLERISDFLDIYILTADTFGTASKACEDLPVKVKTFPSAEAGLAKLRIVEDLGPSRTMTIANGRNDLLMAASSTLSVGVVGGEGAYSKFLAATDLIVRDINDGLDLVLKPKRLVASLRG